MARAGGRAASDSGCLSGRGPSPAGRGWELGQRSGAALTLTVYECSYTLPALFVAVAADDVS